MSDHITVKDFDALEKMSNTCNQSMQKLEETVAHLQNFADALEGGIFLGDGSDVFVAGLRDKLAQKVSHLQETMSELARNLMYARNQGEDDNTWVGQQFMKH